jgi:hypothetical protein
VIAPAFETSVDVVEVAVDWASGDESVTVFTSVVPLAAVTSSTNVRVPLPLAAIVPRFHVTVVTPLVVVTVPPPASAT